MSRIEVLHVCHLVVGNTNEILHHIRNYGLLIKYDVLSQFATLALRGLILGHYITT